MLEKLDITTLKIMNIITWGAISRRLVSNGIKYLYEGIYGKMFSPHDAIGHFSLATHVDPSNADAYTELAIHGNGHLLISEEDAIKALSNAIQTDSTFFRAYLHRAVFRGAESLVSLQMEDSTLESIILRDRKKIEKSGDALCDYASAIKYNPDFLYPYYDRGCLHYMWGAEDKAMADFERAMTSKDSNLKEIAEKKIRELKSNPKRSQRFKGKQTTQIDFKSAIEIENKRREMIITRNSFYWHFLREPKRTKFEYDPKVFQ